MTGYIAVAIFVFLLASLFWACTKWGRNLAMAIGSKLASKKKPKDELDEEPRRDKKHRDLDELLISSNGSVKIMPMLSRWLEKRAEGAGSTLEDEVNAELMIAYTDSRKGRKKR